MPKTEPTSPLPPEAVPPAIARFLADYARQRRVLLLLRELLLMAMLLIAVVIFSCLADRVLQLRPRPRGVLLVMTLAGFGLWLGSLLWRSLFTTLTPAQTALAVELLRPDLDERLATVCSRLADADNSIASRAMLQAVAHQVESCIQAHGMPQLVSFRTLGYHAAGAGLMVLVLAVLLALPLLGMPSLLTRFAFPWIDAPPVTTTQLHLVGSASGEIGVREGETAILDLFAAHTGDHPVLLNYSTDGRTWAWMDAVQVEPLHYQVTMGPLFSDQRIYFSAGDAKTPMVRMRLLRKPAIAEFRILYEYPSYLQRKPFAVTNTTGLIEAPVGTTATLTLAATDALESARLQSSDVDLQLTLTPDPSIVQGTLTVKRDQPYTLSMRSIRGLEGAGPPDTVIRALPDRAPFVRLVSPSEDLRLSPRDISQFRHEASDDYGVFELLLRLQINGSQAIELPVRSSGDPRRLEGVQDLDLANFGLRIGDVLAVSYAARDGTGQSSVSETRHIIVSPHSLSTADYARMNDLQRSTDLAKALMKELEASKQALQNARANKSQLEKFADANSQYQQHIARSGENAEVLLAALTRAVSQSSNARLNDLLSHLADQAEVRMIEAHGLVDELGKGDTREEGARQRLELALEQTRDLQKQLETLTAAERAAAALSDLRNLAAAEEARKSGRMTGRAAEMLGRMRQDVNDQVRQLGIDPGNPTADQQLQSRIDQGQQAVKDARRPDLVAAARQWAGQSTDEKIHPPMFDRRLAVAADVESARMDAHFVRARDLNLSSRAARALWALAQDPDPRVRQVAEDARKQFAGALEDLEKHNAATTRPTDRPEPALVQAADSAREKMARWAGESSPAQGPDNTNKSEDENRELAMEANAQMMQRRYDRASELQKRMALEQNQAAEAQEAMDIAQTADQLAQGQDNLRNRVAAAGDNAGQYAQEQRDVARQIAAQTKSNHPGQPYDTRQEALIAIQAIQERLAQMPQQLQDLTNSADVQFQAHALAQGQAETAQATRDPRRAAALRAAERAAAAEADARKETQKALVPVDPQVVALMSAGLVDYLPETGAAAQVLEKRLAPALQSVKDATGTSSDQDLVRGVRQAREAIAEAQLELRQAQDALLDMDPLFAARVYADAAAQALSRVPPDVKAAIENQSRASQALSRQWQLSIYEAAHARMPMTDAADAMTRPGKKPANAQELAAARQWGILRQRENTEASAPNRDEDPTGYRKMLQVYFRTLGKARGQEGR